MTASIISEFNLRGTEKANRSDREWFEQHPDRQYRVRQLIEGEDTPPGGSLDIPPANFTGWRWTFVKQFEPGARARIFGTTPIHVAPTNTDAAIAEVFAKNRLAPTVISRIEGYLAGDAVDRSKVLDFPGSFFLMPVPAVAS